MQFYLTQSVLGLTMNEYIVEVMRLLGTVWTHDMNDLRLNVTGEFSNPCGITSHSHSIPLGDLTAVLASSVSFMSM